MEYDGQPEMASFFDDLCFFWVLFLRILLGLGEFNGRDVRNLPPGN
jgi:hypothetical protein